MIKRFSLIIAGFLAGIAVISLGWRWASRKHRLPCPSRLSWLLDNPLTAAVAGAQTTLDRIGLQPGERGLDVGCGPGRLAIPAAHRVGPAGSITAVDVQPDMLARLEKRIGAGGLSNIVPMLSDITTDTQLPPAGFDRAWLVTVLGEIPNRQAALQNIHRVLKPGGILSVTEIFPDPHFQPRGVVLKLGAEAGFVPGDFWGSALAFTQNLVKR
jgi:ubiquinone/menaquinone biosynthesis C-methylase UbiE